MTTFVATVHLSKQGHYNAHETSSMSVEPSVRGATGGETGADPAQGQHLVRQCRRELQGQAGNLVAVRRGHTGHQRDGKDSRKGNARRPALAQGLLHRGRHERVCRGFVADCVQACGCAAGACGGQGVLN